MPPSPPRGRGIQFFISMPPIFQYLSLKGRGKQDTSDEKLRPFDLSPKRGEGNSPYHFGCGSAALRYPPDHCNTILPWTCQRRTIRRVRALTPLVCACSHGAAAASNSNATGPSPCFRTPGMTARLPLFLHDLRVFHHRERFTLDDFYREVVRRHRGIADRHPRLRADVYVR
jgi:hypothetical protein